MSILPEVLAINHLLTDTSGSIGDIVASRNQHGRYFRARVSPIQPNTRPQVAARTQFGLLSKRWGNVLTAAQRAAWNDLASRSRRSPYTGSKAPGSGRGAYIACNLPRRIGGFPVVDNPPGSIGGVQFDGFTVSLDLIGGILQTRGLWNVTNPWQTIAGAFMQVQTSRIEKPSINYIRGPWHTGTFVPAFSFPPYVSDRNPITAFPNPRRAARARVCLPDGRSSAWQFAFTFDYHKP